MEAAIQQNEDLISTVKVAHESSTTGIPAGIEQLVQEIQAKVDEAKERHKNAVEVANSNAQKRKAATAGISIMQGETEPPAESGGEKSGMKDDLSDLSSEHDNEERADRKSTR